MTSDIALLLGGFALGFSWGVLCATPVFREAFIDGMTFRFIWGKKENAE
jgi:hypothetical protein